MRLHKFLIAMLCASGLVSAEERSAGGVDVQGMVQDSSGAVILKAKLKLRSGEEEGQKVSTEDGRFIFPGVPPGNYVIRAESKGFETTKVKVKVEKKALRNVRIAMEVAAETSSVTVSGSRKNDEESVSPERNADQLSFEKESLVGLPAQDQNPLSLIGSFTSKAAQGAEGLNVLVDGMEMNAANLPASAIRRVRVNHNPYSARFRRPGKGRVEVLTEEGSMRRLRGGFTYSARNDLFDARNAFASSKPALDRRLIEGNFSAPIVKQKATFFITAQRLTDNETAVVNALTTSGPLIANVPQSNNRSSLLSRFDLKPNELNTFNAVYSFRDENQSNRGAGGFHLPQQGIPEAERQQRLQLADSQVVSSKLINEVRFSIDREEHSLGRAAAGPEILVNGAFTGGEPQTFWRREDTGLRVQDTATYYAGKHSILFGGEFHPAWFRAVDRSNFGGTYQFASLLDYEAGHTIAFSQNQGDPTVAFLQAEAFGFVQDEKRVSPALMVTVGLRYGWQSNVARGSGLAPRLSFAYSLPAHKTVIRGGTGLFYERVSDEVARNSALFDGFRLQQLVAGLPSVVREAAALKLPSVWQASLGVERELWKRTILSVEYQATRGENLLRSHDINAPDALTLVRPDNRFGNVDQVESSGVLRGQALTVTWRGSVKKWFSGMAQYALSKTKDDTSGPFFLPASNFDLTPEYGRSDFDQRHRFNLAGTTDLPFGFRVGIFATLGSGVPYNITTGRDDNGDTVAADRPIGIGRNTGMGPGLARVDLRVTKLLHGPRLFDRSRDHTSPNVEVSADAFNIFNRVNFTNFVGVESSPFFGRANGSLAARTIQFSLRYRF